MTWQCPTSKQAFSSGGQARAAIRSVRRKGARRPEDKKPQHAYVCEFCGQWHLTSQPR